jgi:hypothetical protein
MFAFLSRIKNGIIMAGISIRYMLARPKLLFFPLFRIVLFSLYVPLFFFALFYGFVGIRPLLINWELSKGVASALILGFLLLWLFIAVCFSFFIMLFSNVATVDYLWDLFQGKKPSIRTSLGVACKRIPILLAWSAIFSGVRFLISLIGGDKDSSGLRKIVAGASDVAWAAATYFVVPVISEKRASVADTFKQSYQLMKERFGEVVGVAVSFNLVAGIIFPGIFCLVAAIMNYLYDSGQGERMAIDFYHYPHAKTILITVGFITLILRVFITTAQDVFKAAAYSYANGKPTGPFTPERISESFETKK